jgi:flagellar export protein FliJ
MAKGRALERLWRLRELEEEQSRVELESKVLDRRRVETQLAEATESAAHSRQVFADRLADPDTSARAGAILELEQARRSEAVLRPRWENAAAEVERQREEFGVRRTGRLQVETLLDREREAEREDAIRRAQQMLDDWYGRRRSVNIVSNRIDGSSSAARRAR